MVKLSRAIFLVFLLYATHIAAQEVQPTHNDNINYTEPSEQPILITNEDSSFITLDTIGTLQDNPQTTETTHSDNEIHVWHPNPTRSLWLSIVFPGLGQIYNRKYWKLPIVYGGFMGCAYAITWNNKYYQDYLSAYKDIMDADPNTKSYTDMLPYGTDPESSYAVSYLNEKQNYYRKYRDLSIIITVAVYAVSIIDAFVDAQLSDFDISPDVSMRVQPTLIENPQRASLAASSLGMQFRITF